VDDFQFFEKTTINFIGYITTLLEEIDDHHHHQPARRVTVEKDI
jgi:hypothetical protein